MLSGSEQREIRLRLAASMSRTKGEVKVVRAKSDIGQVPTPYPNPILVRRIKLTACYWSRMPSPQSDRCKISPIPPTSQGMR
jgi:hypothetical protein